VTSVSFKDDEFRRSQLSNTGPNFGGMPNVIQSSDSAARDTSLDYQANTKLLHAQLFRAQLRHKHYTNKILSTNFK
jgi:hypothetical protein